MSRGQVFLAVKLMSLFEIKNRLENKVVLITGGTSGIGRATALAFAEAGARIVIADIREQPIGDDAPTVDIIRQRGGSALFVQTDVAQKSQVAIFVDRALQEFGRVDILVNNAGFGHISLVEHTPDELLRRLLAVNFCGVVYGVQTVLPIMRNQGSGHVINISSGAAVLGLPYAGIYAATKAAIARFSEALRYELEGTNIHVSVIYPDFTSTDLAFEVALDREAPLVTVRSLSPQWVVKQGSPKARLQSPEKVARAVVACALHPCREVYLTGRIRFHGLFRRLCPALVDREANRIKMSVRELLARVEREEIQKEKTKTSQDRRIIH